MRSLDAKGGFLRGWERKIVTKTRLSCKPAKIPRQSGKPTCRSAPGSEAPHPFRSNRNPASTQIDSPGSNKESHRQCKFPCKHRRICNTKIILRRRLQSPPADSWHFQLGRLLPGPSRVPPSRRPPGVGTSDNPSAAKSKYLPKERQTGEG